MTNIGTVANEIGLIERPGERGVLMGVIDGKLRHAYLSDAAEMDVADGFEALWAAGGLFKDGSLKDNKGRTRENLSRVLWLPLDFDLLDYLGCPPVQGQEDDAARKALKGELYAMPQDEIDELINALRSDVEVALEKLGIPIHRLDYTGYGICSYVYIVEEDQTRIDDTFAAHAHLIKVINNYVGTRFVDSDSSGSGTRGSRLPGSWNNKGPIPRFVQSLIPYNGQSSPLGERPHVPRPMGRAIPREGVGLTPEDAKSFIDAIAPSWIHGHRHGAALAVSGMLAKAGIPESQAVAIIEEIAAGDAEIRDRRKSIETTYARMRAGGAVAGYSRLRDLLPESAIRFVDQLLERYRNSTAGSVSIGSFDVLGTRGTSVNEALDGTEVYKRREKQVVSLASAPPESAFYGWFANYRDVVAPTTEASDALHLGASLTVVGAMIGRRVGAQFGSDDIFPTLYTVLVGATGWSRKETAMKRAIDQLPRPLPGSFQQISPFFNTTSDITSSEGMADILERDPNTLVRLAELTLLFSNMQRKGTTNLADRLINLWDSPSEFVVNRTGGKSTKAINPTLSILAATQPGRLADAMTQEHLLSGFANRLTFVTGKPKPAMAQPAAIDREAMWSIYRTITDAINAYPQGTLLPRSRDTDKRFEDWYLEIRSSPAHDEETEAMRARHQMMALKIALIYAVSERSPEIKRHHLEPAIVFVEWMWRNLIVLMRSWGVAYWSQIEQRIEDVLIERGPLRRGTLGKTCANRKWNTRDFGMVLDALIKNDRVGIDASGICRWIHELDVVRTHADKSLSTRGHDADTDEGAKFGGFTGDLRA